MPSTYNKLKEKFSSVEEVGGHLRRVTISTALLRTFMRYMIDFFHGIPETPEAEKALVSVNTTAIVALCLAYGGSMAYHRHNREQRLIVGSQIEAAVSSSLVLDNIFEFFNFPPANGSSEKKTAEIIAFTMLACEFMYQTYKSLSKSEPEKRSLPSSSDALKARFKLPEAEVEKIKSTPDAVIRVHAFNRQTVGAVSGVASLLARHNYIDDPEINEKIAVVTSLLLVGALINNAIKRVPSLTHSYNKMLQASSEAVNLYNGFSAMLWSLFVHANLDMHDAEGNISTSAFALSLVITIAAISSAFISMVTREVNYDTVFDDSKQHTRLISSFFNQCLAATSRSSLKTPLVLLSDVVEDSLSPPQP